MKDAATPTFAERMQPLLKKIADGEMPDSLKWGSCLRNTAAKKMATQLNVKRIPNRSALVACTQQTVVKMGCSEERIEAVGRTMGGLLLWTQHFSSAADAFAVDVHAEGQSVKVTYLSEAGKAARARACGLVDARTLFASRRCSYCGALAREVCSKCHHQ